MRSLPLAVLLTCVCVGCSSANAPGDPDAGPCGPCPAGQGCDVGQSACVPAAGEGERCGADAPDGGLTVCQDGLDCGFVAGGTHVCSRLCTDSSQCGAGKACFTAQWQGSTRNYCAKSVALGEACGAAELLQCAGGSNGQIIQCIDSGTDAGSRCMLRCEDRTDCAAAQDCSVAFGDGNGVCVAPTQPGDPCDQSQFVFCSAGQVCVVVSGTSGFCHTTCPTAGRPCDNGDACISADPCSNSGQPFCVTPQPIDGSCDALRDQFCGPGADCVNLGAPDGGALLTCKADCTSGQSCASGTCRSAAYCSLMACF